MVVLPGTSGGVGGQRKNESLGPVLAEALAGYDEVKGGELMSDNRLCRRCGKDMGRGDDGPTIKGIKVTVQLGETQQTPADIEYNNRQLGKYSDGNGGCDVGICYECYIDVLFGVKGAG